MDCINLKERLSKRYRIRWEEPANSLWIDPWYQYIPCQYGRIYPHGGNELGFASKKRGPVARRVASLPGARIVQDADDGLNIVFPVEQFKQVAEVVKPRRRRQMSEEQRTVAVARLKKYQFTAGHGKETVPERTQAVLVDV